jgi:endoglucanase
MKTLILFGAYAGGVVSQSAAWAQCGGQGWTGATTCVSGYTCVYENAYYSQCQPGSATTSTATTLSTSTTKTSSTMSTSTPASTGSFKWFGVDESGAEVCQVVDAGRKNDTANDWRVWNWGVPRCLGHKLHLPI